MFNEFYDGEDSLGIDLETHNKIVRDRDKKIEELENENRRLEDVNSFLYERISDLAGLNKMFFENIIKNIKKGQPASWHNHT